MDTFLQDLSYCLRSLLRAPRFTAVVVITLALGIGANSAIFSALNAVLLRPLPFRDAERVVNLTWEGGGYLQQLSAMKFQYWHDHARSFESMATWQSFLARVDTGSEVSAARALRVSSDFLPVLGFPPIQTHEREVIISHAMSLTHPGRTIRLNDEVMTIAGVLPESFLFPYENEAVDVIVPLELSVDPNNIAEDWPTIARLERSVTYEQAQAETTALNVSFRSAYPNQASATDRGMKLATFSELYVDRNIRRALWILMGTITLVLFIACANVANLFLARATQRRGEIALRTALGATHGRITRLVFTESILVTLAAGALGLLLGTWIVRVLVALSPLNVPRLGTVGIDWRVMLFTFVAALATNLLFGGVAAWPAVSMRLAEELKESARTTLGRSWLRQGLLFAQAAFSTLLLVGAGLLVATLIGLMRVDLGFDPVGVVAVRFPAKPAGYETSEARWQFEQKVMRQLENSSLIDAVAGASSLPLERGVNTPISITNRPDNWGTVEWRAVTPEYFRTLKIALRSGRSFADSDRAGTPTVAIINEAFSRRYFPNQNPIGQRIDVGRAQGKFIHASLAGPGVEIVGIVADIREASVRSEARRTMYVPQAQAPTLLSNTQRTMPVFIARARTGKRNLEDEVSQAVHAADPSVPRPQVFPLSDAVTRSLVLERFGAMLLSVLAALALTLTAFGIYGVLAYTVQQRLSEIGIRMALGAARGQVTQLLMVQGIIPVLGGVLLGVIGSLGLSRVVAGFLWGVTPTDLTTIVTAATILLAVALVSSWIPTRQAADINPARVLTQR